MENHGWYDHTPSVTIKKRLIHNMCVCVRANTVYAIQVYMCTNTICGNTANPFTPRKRYICCSMPVVRESEEEIKLYRFDPEIDCADRIEIYIQNNATRLLCHGRDAIVVKVTPPSRVPRTFLPSLPPPPRRCRHH